RCRQLPGPNSQLAWLSGESWSLVYPPLGPTSAWPQSKLRAKKCLVGLALSDKAAISSAVVTMMPAIRSLAKCCGGHCLVFDQSPLGSRSTSGSLLMTGQNESAMG